MSSATSLAFEINFGPATHNRPPQRLIQQSRRSGLTREEIQRKQKAAEDRRKASYFFYII